VKKIDFISKWYERYGEQNNNRFHCRLLSVALSCRHDLAQDDMKFPKVNAGSLSSLKVTDFVTNMRMQENV
jgi:hypothetical protein